jgi:hypothetical protein
MLPGLRFLFVAIVLSLSMLIFGLGAMSLLRSAHEEFASLPTRHAQPETVFAQPIDASRPTLAMLRVDEPVTSPSGVDHPATPDAPNAAPPPEQPSPIVSVQPDRTAAEPGKTVPETDKVAALTTTTPSEQKSESSDKSAEAPVQAETAARTETTASPENQQLQAVVVPEPAPAATIEATVVASEPTVASEPMNAPIDDSAKAAASTKIATLGGPAVTIGPQPASTATVAILARRAHLRHLVRRRRVARPRIVPPKPVTLGFFEPLPTADRPSRQN